MRRDEIYIAVLCISVFLHVDVELIEWDLDSILVERFFHRLEHIEINGPVVRGFAPYHRFDVDAACGMGGHSDRRRRILENQRVFVADFFQYCLRLFEVCRIRDGKYLIDAAGLFFGVVHDFACRELSVRYEDDFVVDRAYFCVADENILDGALISARRYIVVVAERAGYQHENAAGEVRQSTVDCKTDADAERRYQRGESARIEPEITDQTDADENFKSDFCNIRQSSENRLVYIFVFFDFFLRFLLDFFTKGNL